MSAQQLDFETWTKAQTYPHAAPGQTEAAKQEGMTRAEMGAALLDAEWKERAYMAVIACAEANAEFICDRVWDYLEPQDKPPLWPKPKALGAVVLKAARDGFIRRTDRTKLTENSARHRSPVPIWQSLTRDRQEAA